LKARLRFTCSHRHNGLAHPQCYEAVHPGERIGFLDIEATSLNASFGYCLTYCIKRYGGEILKRWVTPKEIRGYQFDKRLMGQLLEDLTEFDRVITYYGTGYDLPFLRTRCLTHGLDFPPMGSLFHTDVYYSVRNKLRLYRNRMEVACSQFGIESKGHRLTPEVWMKAQAGDQGAIDYVLQHNIEDVESLEKLYDKMEGHYRLNKTSV
jgi:uncharacterized protein YprB with RNaseH-like and TPR domain